MVMMTMRIHVWIVMPGSLMVMMVMVMVMRIRAWIVMPGSILHGDD